MNQVGLLIYEVRGATSVQWTAGKSSIDGGTFWNALEPRSFGPSEIFSRQHHLCPSFAPEHTKPQTPTSPSLTEVTITDPHNSAASVVAAALLFAKLLMSMAPAGTYPIVPLPS